MMEGWLYVLSTNRLGLSYCRKRFFILEDNHLNCFKSKPSTSNEEPIKTATVDSCVRVNDYGRVTIHRKAFFIFSLYNASNRNDRLKLGTRSPEDAAKWIHCFQEAALKECPGATPCSKKLSFRTNGEKKKHERRSSIDRRSSLGSSADFVDLTGCSSPKNLQMKDVVAPSSWMIFACQNGLRFFKESKEGDNEPEQSDQPATMAVGVIDAPSESVFEALLSLGPSRSEWDFCFLQGRVIEQIDGHTDVIHKQLTSYWLPWGMKRRDLLLRRYWRREDDGTYVILYHSVFHKRCLPESGFVRAWLKSGGYVVSPVNQGKQSVVKHTLAIDWKFWKACLPKSSRSITIRMLGRIAALREFFKARLGNYLFLNHSSNEMTKDIGLLQVDNEDMKDVRAISDRMTSVLQTEDEALNLPTKDGCFQMLSSKDEALQSPTKHAYLTGSFLEMDNAPDEFFDVPECEQADYDPWDQSFFSDPEQEMHTQDQQHTDRSSAADSTKTDHPGEESPDSMPCSYGTTLLNDPSCTSACSWTTADPPTFLIRGKNYLQTNKKVKANDTLMQLAGVDWLKSDKREDNLGAHPRSIVQKSAAQGGNEFFFIINLQVPGATTYNLALYYMFDGSIESVPLLYSFVKGDNAYRNSRFKLIPYISKGSWIVKQSVGKKACLVGQALEINYFEGKNYLELGVDVGSSSVARGVINLVLGYLNNLVVEMAFVIQANTEEELPECVIGTCRLNHMDASKAVLLTP